MKNIFIALKDIWSLTKPYFITKDRGTIFGYSVRENYYAIFTIAFLLAMNVAQVYLLVYHNEWYGRFYDALQKKNEIAFWIELKIFVYIILAFMISSASEFYVSNVFMLRWREWLTKKMIGDWLRHNAHYRMGIWGEADNPDQRIAEDARKFTSATLSIFIQFFSAILTLYKFAIILWILSASFPVNYGGFDFTSVPGYLVWVALLYTIIGTWIIHLIGKRLVSVDFIREKTVSHDSETTLVRNVIGDPSKEIKNPKIKFNPLVESLLVN